jgi:glycosyltransferase involved in cell wall biosynthesis
VRVRLHVAGRFWHEPDREEFERRIAAGDLTDTALPGAPAPVVKYHGFVEGDAKRRLFMDSDCYCFPTYYASEGQPVSLIEALAFDLPVVTTRWRALPDFFPEGYPGLVEPRAPVQVATAVELMMRQPPSVDFRRLFLEHYTEEKFISNLKAALVGLA